ncbi:MAG: ATP-binding protein [Planctomycetota bacterium]
MLKSLDWEESASFECKRLAGGKLSRVLESIVAFANTEGGVIALGLEDPGKARGRARIFGVDEKRENLDELKRMCVERVTDSALLKLQLLSFECSLRDGSKGTVCYLSVPKSACVHSVVGGGTFVRLDKSNRQLSAREITELAFARGVVSAESGLVDVAVDLLQTDHWELYATRRRLTRALPDALRHLGLAKSDAEGRLKPIRAAVLLFADDPSALLGEKAALRVLHYQGATAHATAQPNLIRPPVTVTGPLYAQIRDATSTVMGELARGVQLDQRGLQVVQLFPDRVVLEAITNAVIHRDYRLPMDTQVRIFSDRIEVESPGLLPGPVTADNISRVGTHARNPVISNHLREFPDPPNLDAGEGVRMMFGEMWARGLYPPIYFTRPQLSREAVRVVLLNEHRPTLWEMASSFIDREGSIANADLRLLMETDSSLKASKQLKSWVERGLLVVSNPNAGKKSRRYTKPGKSAQLFSTPVEENS